MPSEHRNEGWRWQAIVICKSKVAVMSVSEKDICEPEMVSVTYHMKKVEHNPIMASTTYHMKKR